MRRVITNHMKGKRMNKQVETTGMHLEWWELKDKVTKLCRQTLNAKCLYIKKYSHPGDHYLYAVMSIQLDDEGYLPSGAVGDKPYIVHTYNTQTQGLVSGHCQLDWMRSREVFYGKIRDYQPELEEEVSYE